ncbi:unnamed protein product [Penicillium roqueforti FM164]|uniref:Genomic scaffold, ProqFM164S02 n=1 Tax=Penicillium roqueforti (strain FM164) TaxID=1365484 RepID=W6Q428_PENRF|nr:unnamed protein product [Penicillium roqueforti FM164]
MAADKHRRQAKALILTRERSHDTYCMTHTAFER